MNVFLSTPSARRATPAALAASCKISISIHALREEGDLLGRVFFLVASKFLSTPSARRATFDSIDYISNQEFLSTPSARRATSCPKDGRLATCISIHALREEGDRKIMKTTMDRGISIHALREEGDPPQTSAAADRVISIHALREEGDVDYRAEYTAVIQFLSTPSARRAT